MRIVFKLAAGIFLGLTAFVAVKGVMQRLAQQRAIDEFDRQMRTLGASGPADPPASRRAGEKLAGNEECIAGTVVRRSRRNGVPAAEQVLENLRPVPCEDDHRR
jgi:hypothetical protein